MAEKHENIDVTTLKEVERLLTSTEFASASDLIAQGGVVEVAAAERSVSETVEAEGATPLPKRR